MSRNIRKKTTKTVASRKTTALKSSPASSDDDYAELDEISDSDDDEPDVELAEEKAIIASLANGSDDEDADDESNDDDAPQPEDDEDDNESFNGFPADEPADFFNEQLPPTVRRRVHFDLDEEVDYSSNSDTDSGDFQFPDLLAEEDLDPKFRQEIQNDDADEDTSSETFWDWQNATANYDNIDIGENMLVDAFGEDDDSSSDIDSDDEGLTTEEDLPSSTRRDHIDPSRTSMQRRDTRCQSTSSEEEVTVTRTPKLGTFHHDGSTSFALTDHSSQKLMVFMAKTQRRHTVSGVQPTNRAETPFTPATELFSDMSQMIMRSPHDVMLGASWTNSRGGFMFSPEAVDATGFSSLNHVIHGSQQSSSTEEDVDSEFMPEIAFEDFVNHDSSDEGDSPSPIGLESSPSTRRPSTAMSMVSQEHDLLSHLDHGLVGAFRRNQNNHRLITRKNESHESLAFSTPTHEGTLRGVKQGKLAAVNTPITPLRKSKAKFEEFSMLNANSKRKFSGEQSIGMGHKRTRSMA